MQQLAPRITRILMCRPTHFHVDYQINPWMQIGSADTNLALQQWQVLVDTYQQLGIQVDIIDQQPELPDMVFTANQAVRLHPDSNRLLLGRFRYPQRQPEIEHFRRWFKQQNIAYDELSDPQIVFEGEGETSRAGQTLFLGIGFRSDEATSTYFTNHLHHPIVTLQLINDRFYHLDTCLFTLNSQTGCYYPGAFSSDSQRLLQTHIPDLIEITESEAYNFAANSIATENHIIMPTNCPLLKHQLITRGYTIHEVSTSEFLKAGGGLRCLTLILDTKS